MEKQKTRETSKILLWTVIALSCMFSVASLILAYLAGELGITITVIGGLWSAAVPVAIGCYSNKAKAENEIKLQMMLQGPPPELLQAKEQLATAQAKNKKLTSERDAARKEAAALRARLTPIEDIIANAQATPAQNNNT